LPHLAFIYLRSKFSAQTATNFSRFQVNPYQKQPKEFLTILP